MTIGENELDSVFQEYAIEEQMISLKDIDIFLVV